MEIWQEREGRELKCAWLQSKSTSDLLSVQVCVHPSTPNMLPLLHPFHFLPFSSVYKQRCCKSVCAQKSRRPSDNACLRRQKNGNAIGPLLPSVERCSLSLRSGPSDRFTSKSVPATRISRLVRRHFMTARRLTSIWSFAFSKWKKPVRGYSISKITKTVTTATIENDATCNQLRSLLAAIP
jgi:hypothetical protein